MSLEDFTEATLSSYNIGRVENYMTESREIKQDFAYGDRDSDLLVWYQMEDIQAFFNHYEFPSIPRWENSRVWRGNLIEYGGHDSKRGNPRGGRGRGQGRGSRSRGRGNRRDDYQEDRRMKSSGAGRGGYRRDERRRQGDIYDDYQSYQGGYGGRDDSRRRRYEDERMYEEYSDRDFDRSQEEDRNRGYYEDRNRGSGGGSSHRYGSSKGK